MRKTFLLLILTLNTFANYSYEEKYTPVKSLSLIEGTDFTGILNILDLTKEKVSLTQKDSFQLTFYKSRNIKQKVKGSTIYTCRSFISLEKTNCTREDKIPYYSRNLYNVSFSYYPENCLLQIETIDYKSSCYFRDQDRVFSKYFKKE